ncbi:MAG: alkene reductase [Gammaproteobacteria bacterium]|nr:alkene reductase [Gammaproteobacteria bacterium]
MVDNQSLLEPYALSSTLHLKNRVVMAPMTRDMSHDDLSPTKAMAEYYARRADAGLIITEGTIIRPDAKGYKNVPGIYTPAHIDGWKRVTDSVHEQGGKIFSQIWHLGRVSHPHYLNGELPLSASETTMTGKLHRAEGLSHGKSRAVSVAEIKSLVESYAIAAKSAMQAGFDGVEVHGANGYLIDQFMHYHTNLRDDEYGGSPENMARFALEVVKACGEAIGFDKVGLRVSPAAYINEIAGDKRDAAGFQLLFEKLNKLGLAYVHTGNFNDKNLFEDLGNKTMTEFIRAHYRGTLIAAGSYNFDEAAEKIKTKQFDLIAIGRPFIANPDLIQRLQNNQEIKAYEASMLNVLY